MLRNGRFDLKVEAPLPCAEDLLRILRYHLGGVFVGSAFSGLARAAVGSSAADVDAAIRKARGVARREGRPLRPDDVMLRSVGQSPIGSDQDLRVAIHEWPCNCGDTRDQSNRGSRRAGQRRRAPTRSGNGIVALMAELVAELACLMASTSVPNRRHKRASRQAWADDALLKSGSEPLLSRCPPIRLRHLSVPELVEFVRREGARRDL
ncbi:MAG: ATPase, central domain protein [Cypionkella sp.]|nr:ATPase, central domain protein [Cypionkella sp.]